MSDNLKRIVSMPLDGRILIEASAGTGKTWTLSRLFLRQLIESRLSLPEILVLTFTRAATQELKERLREQVAEACEEARLLAKGQSPDTPGLLTVMQREGNLREQDLAQSAAMLTQTLNNFDEASIFTIHGFCQRALRDFSFSAGMGESTVMNNESAAIPPLLMDACRRLYHGPGKFEARWRARNRKLIAPDKIQRLLGSMSRHEGQSCQLTKKECSEDPDSLVIKIESLRQQLRGCVTSDAEWAQLLEKMKTVRGVGPARLGKLAGVWSWLKGEEERANGLEKLLDWFRRSKLTAEAPDPESFDHAIHDLLEDWLNTQTELEELLWDRLHNDVATLLMELPEELRADRLGQGRFSHNDSLVLLHRALTGPDGDTLRARLHERWKRVLVDEYQDTDPLQAEILNQLFGQNDGTMIQVGDPKQAIYGFRGADLDTYLREREIVIEQDPSRLRSLEENWRSTPELVDLFNHLFGKGKEKTRNVFYDKRIEAEPVRAAENSNRETLLINGEAAPALTVVTHEEGTQGDNNPLILEDLAFRIKELLGASATGNCVIQSTGQKSPRPLAGSDIAVLVRKKRQLAEVSSTLRRHQIPHVVEGAQSVWQSQSAWLLKLLLLALSNPGNTARLRTMLYSGLFYRDEKRAAGFTDEELEYWVLLLQACTEHWRRHGFIPALRELFRAGKMEQALLSYSDGERLLANLNHLLELLHEASGSRFTEVHDLLRILEMEGSGDEDQEAGEQRLESEHNLVRLTTQHKSKGLQFGVVFAPYLWEGLTIKERVPEVIPDSNGQGLQLELRNLKAHNQTLMLKTLQEETRLAYVTLTRACHRLILHVPVHKRPIEQALGSFFDSTENGLAGSSDLKRPVDHVQAGFKRLATTLGDATVELAEPASIVGEVSDLMLPTNNQELRAAPIPHLVTRTKSWHLSSFSSLVKHGNADDPDHDAPSGLIPEESPRMEASADSIENTFPRGARAGSCLHAIFERAPFSGSPQEIEPVVCEELKLYNFSADLSGDTSNWVHRVLNATPGGKPALSRLHLADMQHELEFHLRTGLVYGPALEALLRDTGYLSATRLGVEGRQLEGSLAAAGEMLSNGIPPGLLKGFIDLVYTENERWYILDWKSNALGTKPADYGRAEMVQEMCGNGYFLQALFYGLALHRMLKAWLPGYMAEQHLGGYRYLFLRGIQAGESATGFFDDDWPRGLITGLDELAGGARHV